MAKKSFTPVSPYQQMREMEEVVKRPFKMNPGMKYFIIAAMCMEVVLDTWQLLGWWDFDDWAAPNDLIFMGLKLLVPGIIVLFLKILDSGD